MKSSCVKKNSERATSVIPTSNRAALTIWCFFFIICSHVYASLSSVLKSNEAATAVFRTIVTPSRLRISPVYVQYCPAHS